MSMIRHLARNFSRSSPRLSSWPLCTPHPSAQHALLNTKGIRHFISNGGPGGGLVDSPIRKRYGRRTATNLGIRIVPEKEACVIERFGKFNRVLGPGIHLLVPGVDRISYIHCLKEQAIEIPNQAAVTSDNDILHINGVLYYKVVDPTKASYGIDDPTFAITQLAQTTMRSAIGQITLDRTFMERNALNATIVKAIDDAAKEWGLMCLRYEIRDIIPSREITKTMELQAEAERKKRAHILEAEGLRKAQILNAEGEREAAILKSQGEAEALRVEAEALQNCWKADAVNLKVANQYLQAFNNLAQKSTTTIMLPTSANDQSSLVSQTLSLYKSMVHNNKSLGGQLLEGTSSTKVDTSQGGGTV